jgi:hypothetical protein
MKKSCVPLVPFLPDYSHCYCELAIDSQILKPTGKDLWSVARPLATMDEPDFAVKPTGPLSEEQAWSSEGTQL